jgi:hypothetical protein
MSLLDYKKVLREDVEFFNRYKHIYSDDISKLFEKLKIPVAYRIKLKNRLLELYDEIYIKPEEPENIQLLVEEIIGSDINRKLLIAVPYSRITANYLNYLLRDFNKVDVNKIYAIHALQAFVFYILNKIVKKLEEKLLQQIAQEFQNYLLTLQNKLPIEDKETFFKLIMEIIKQLHPEVSKNEELQRGIKQLVSESKTEVKQKKRNRNCRKGRAKCRFGNFSANREYFLKFEIY